MSETVIDSFRTSVAGFHKGDVVSYIARTTEKYEKELKEKECQLEQLESELAELRMVVRENEQLKQHIAELELDIQKATQAQTEVSEDNSVKQTAENPLAGVSELELEAYRRAQYTERLARERAKLVYSELRSLGEGTSAACVAAGSQIDAILSSIREDVQKLEAVQNGLVNDLNNGSKRVSALCMPLVEEERII